ncbi:hypothetical protein GCM10010398_36880 [Streptomyces fimbriatus]
MGLVRLTSRRRVRLAEIPIGAARARLGDPVRGYRVPYVVEDAVVLALVTHPGRTP